MGFVDFVVNRHFRDEKAGRVVVISTGVRNRGYLVGSAGDEQRMRGFLKMFLFAQFSLQTLGLMLVCTWVSSLGWQAGKPTLEHELVRGGVFLAAYALIVGLPFFFLFRAFRKAVPSFVSLENEVPLSRRPMARSAWIAIAALAALALLLACAVFALIRAR